MLSIVMPTYNESKNIETLFGLISKSLKGVKYEIVVVDDNSPDGTSELAKILSKKYPIRVLDRYKNPGLSESVVDGIKIAKGEFVCVMDADLQHPPEVITKMLNETKNYDLVVASRLVEGGGTEGWPKERALTSYIATFLARPLTKINDPMSGFFMFRKDKVDINKIKPCGYKILLEIAVKSGIDKIKEVPFIFKDRTLGTSKLTFKVNILYMKHLISLYYYTLTIKVNNLFNK